ncbi:MAG: WG repeat-containing protein [Gomphosphaeria aponina SAG 52.96 = DSM 107014]|uniref:WG repeat-containing protein n=1 Tax=Gomphosphaeria aponina SAG 52.96 = DSM 107014 TaxID=1521640 RepID=A0A941GS34_9CHRO|nr:WG repeat-containing protein [Gomphosphaeria aponina SAG 52.96 = DSM 107014]
MSYCLNPNCHNPYNPTTNKFCQHCGSKLLLKDRYRALKQIGEGGFGKTFLAVDEDIPSKPDCVIKQFLPQAQGTTNVEKATKLFEQEAIQLDTLGKHDQIPKLLAHFEQDGRLYLLQEFVDGQNLAEELTEKGVFNEQQIRQLLQSLLPVLHFIYKHKVIHRDIKPENIIRRRKDSQLVLVDFGAAKFANEKPLNQTGTIIGTPGYAAPEQGFGKANFSSDLYSLGVTCLHLLTNIEPFQLLDASNDEWVWRDYLNHPVSFELGQILDKLVQEAVKERYQSAAEVLQDLNPAGAAKPKRQGLKLVEIGDKYGYIDNNGQLIIGLHFEKGRHFSEGLAGVKLGNKWGYIDKNGRWIIPPQFSQVGDLCEGLAPFKITQWLGMRQKWGYLNNQGQVVIPPQFNEALNFAEGLAVVRLGSCWGFINLKGELVIQPQFDKAYSFSQGLARVSIGLKWGYINQSGQMVIPPRDNGRDFSEDLAAVEINHKWGYINQKGILTIQPSFNAALDFSEGLAPVLQEIKLLKLLNIGERWGYVNKSGGMLIEPQFEWALGFSEGLAAVKKNEKWGYINKVGLMIIPPRFDLAGYFRDGMAEVVMNGACRYIDKRGNFIY